MADRAWMKGTKTLTPEHVQLRGSALITGTQGAVASWEMAGVYDISRVSAGLYRVKTGTDANHIDTYGALVGFSATLYDGGTVVDLVGQLKAKNLSTGVYDFVFATGATATELTSGHEAFFALDFRDAAEAIR